MLEVFITESKKHEFECILADPSDHHIKRILNHLQLETVKTTIVIERMFEEEPERK